MSYYHRDSEGKPAYDNPLHARRVDYNESDYSEVAHGVPQMSRQLMVRVLPQDAYVPTKCKRSLAKSSQVVPPIGFAQHQGAELSVHGLINAGEHHDALDNLLRGGHEDVLISNNNDRIQIQMMWKGYFKENGRPLSIPVKRDGERRLVRRSVLAKEVAHRVDLSIQNMFRAQPGGSPHLTFGPDGYNSMNVYLHSIHNVFDNIFQVVIIDSPPR